jgi:hypothetical protein
MSEKKLPRTAPRDIEPERAWYYLNDGSVDLVLREPNKYTTQIRLTRKTLLNMLAELKPLKAKRRPS